MLLIGDLLPRIDLLKALERRYPWITNILKEGSFKVVLFLGMLDNQAPAYNAKELAAKTVWKKFSFRFHYFDELGHALDHRSGYNDLTYGVLDPEARKKLAVELAEFFRHQKCTGIDVVSNPSLSCSG